MDTTKLNVRCEDLSKPIYNDQVCDAIVIDKRIYPEDWTQSIILPTFKKGNITLLDNYDYSLLSSLMSRCYTAALNI